jgi:hypothetical protein
MLCMIPLNIGKLLSVADGILHWMIEIGQVNMIMEVSKLASHIAMPCEGHLQAVLHIFGHLKSKHGPRMVFDPSYPDINHTVFKECDWQEFYGDVKEAIPANTPTPLGKELKFDCLLILIMQEISSRNNHELVSSYLSMVLLFSVC